MAADDVAILVGISTYPNPGFAALDGPLNDIALVEQWLADPSGGAVPHIVKITSPNPFPSDVKPIRAPPLASEFEEQFVDLERTRMALGVSRVKGRLYLYFSGHGFSYRDINRDAEAALYAANAALDFYPHIYGTYFARRAKQKALFQEIVLIMDCCRDSEINRMPTMPTLANTPDDGLAANANVRLLAVYAVPKGGKAPELPIIERGNRVHGLLTHALIKTLEEARPDQGSQVSATRVRDHLFQSWESITGANASPRPEILLPGNGEIVFNAKNQGIRVTLQIDGGRPHGALLKLRDGKLRTFAAFSANGALDDDIVPDGPPVRAFTREGALIKLVLDPGFYDYVLRGPPDASGTFKAESGGVHVRV